MFIQALSKQYSNYPKITFKYCIKNPLNRKPHLFKKTGWVGFSLYKCAYKIITLIKYTKKSD